jgi:hypothetical protein
MAGDSGREIGQDVIKTQQVRLSDMVNKRAVAISPLALRLPK